ncbi:enterochelin ABC transporter permease [Corynebacterium sphenisci DSM 44792]|uniref:Enterochelin ABC transporter permease n=1 Tax=Corynebacterium sphenisci DSM 44792 TaxID=1437874 RepID=A0A1L7CXV6_9CORY|nr:iron chelate uptake ABC transporter family permease subunit [Corynebacterium sphenisci]APT90658.1 enterochelin ABC transporter permease [Corynebacterium sphenisci DSM 44792]
MSAPAAPARRSSGPLPTAAARRRYLAVVLVLAALAAAAGFGILAWDNPMPAGSRGWRIIAGMRAADLAVIALVAFCQATATVAFQTVTRNRILTPSIMGFESLYVLVQTAAVFALGAAGATAVRGSWQFLGQVALMVGFAALLYGWLLTGARGDIQVMLLVGIILGAGLGATATFLQRLLTPSDFDVLTARLIGSLANADIAHLPLSAALAGAAGMALYARSRRLNALALGAPVAVNLGLRERRETIIVLLLVSVLMAVSTALVGPMTFLGFLVAMLAYQLADTHDHRLVLPVAWLTGLTVLAGAYFLLRHVFYAEGSVGIIIEVVGGTAFLLHVMRKGRL